MTESQQEIRKAWAARDYHEQQGECLLREAPSVSQAVASAKALRAQAHFVAAAYYHERSRA